jgi:cystathionine beta-lyase
MDEFEAAILQRTRLFLFCNTHNPVGRVYERDELARLAEICLHHDLVICSDEIHCDLVFSGHRHVPIASLAPEVAQHTITLMAPSKTYNIAGLHCSFAIIQNPDLRQAFSAAAAGVTHGANLLGYAAALAAYRHGQEWLGQVLAYMEANREFLRQYVTDHLPGIRTIVPEGTYLAWLDCRDALLGDQPGQFFLQQAHVALNEGTTFGPGGAGFVRLNFACTRSTLVSALDRMRDALAHWAGKAAP